MALTLNNICGFETNGLDEAESTASFPTIVTSPVRSGTYALHISSQFDLYTLDAFEDGSDGGSPYIVGIGLNTNQVGNSDIIRALEGNNQCFRVEHSSIGALRLYDSTGTLVETVTGVFADDNQYHYIEVLWNHSDTGAIEVWVDDTREINRASEDLSQGGSFTRYYIQGLVASDRYYDDFYCYSGATDSNDLLGSNVAIERTYQNTAEDATDQGTTLDQGTWAITGDTPLVEDATPAGYTGAAEDGHTICDEGTRLGPTGGPSLGTIKGAKWIHRLKRGAGSGTTHYKVYGHNGDVTNSDTVTLGTDYANFFTVKDSSVAQVPTTSESFAQGFRKSSGGREIYCAEIWAFILHVAAAAPAGTGVKNPILMGRNPLIGPIG